MVEIAKGGQPIDIGKIEPQEYRGYVFAVEPFDAALPELHALHEAHFAQTERYREHQGLNPDYEAMLWDWRTGRMLQFTMRHEGKLVGNIRMYLTKSRHTGANVAREDTYFVLEEHRKGFSALRFWQYMEQALLALVGDVEIRTDSKASNNIGRLNEYLGYQKVAEVFVKHLNGARHVR